MSSNDRQAHARVPEPVSQTLKAQKFRRRGFHRPSVQLRQNCQFMLQCKAKRGADADVDVVSTARQGVEGSGGPLPFLDQIQRAFGHHDIQHVQTYIGGSAADASRIIGADAYAMGEKIAFAGQPTLHTAAHEAAHVVQQRRGVALTGGVGRAGDEYEQHADAVADAVVQGKSAVGLLDQYAGGGSREGVQLYPACPDPGLPTGRNQVAEGRELGEVEHGPCGTDLRSRIESYSVAGWREYLERSASSPSESIKLALFMARALGRGHINVDDGSSLSLRGIRRVSQSEAEALMEALITTGPALDLADGYFEQPGGVGGVVVAHTGPLLADFNVRFAAPVLVKLSRRKLRFDDPDRQAISAYAKNASAMKEHADDELGRKTSDPVQTLIASALGVATAGVARGADGLLRGNARLQRQAQQDIYNSAMTIGGCIDQIEADEAARRDLFMMAFKGALGAIGGLASGVGAAVIGALSPVAEEAFQFFIRGDSVRQRTKVRDLYIKRVARLSFELGLDGRAEFLETAFVRGLKW